MMPSEKLRLSSAIHSCQGPAEVRQRRKAHVSGSRAGSWGVVRWGRPAQAPAGDGDSGSTSKGPPGPGPWPSPTDPIRQAGAGPGWRVAGRPGAAGHRPGGDAAPVGVGRGRSLTGSAGAGCSRGRTAQAGGCPGRGAGPGCPRAPSAPSPLSASALAFLCPA